MDNFDIVVIGGGIHGVGAAQAAAAKGYSVCVLEQASDLAQGTSSRSSKLIHGGLRYLETGQFALVRECLKERKTLLQNAPGLVKLRPFYIPVYKTTRRRPWQLRLGLSIYALLTGLSPAARFRSIPETDWSKLDGIRLKDLQAIYQYYDAQTNDALLTRAVMTSAQTLGAQLRLNAMVTKIELDIPNLISYRHNDSEYTLQCQVIINAAGPWVNRVLDVVTPEPPQIGIEWVQGTHIIVPGTLEQGCYYLEAPQDQRAVFVIPWQGQIMVGTTEKPFQGDPADVRPTPAEEDYLLQTLSHYFPEFTNLTRADILTSFAGLRVLPSSDDNPFSRPRETILLPDNENSIRLISIYGGKLTAYRATAEKLIKHLHNLPQRKKIADTRRIALSGDIEPKANPGRK